MFGKMFNEKGHVMLKKSAFLIATISVLSWTTLAGADDFVEDFESYEVHAFLDALPNWTTVVFGAANTEVTGGDYYIEDINGSKRLHSPRGGATLAVINADVLTLAAGSDFELSVDMMWIGNGIGNGLIFNYQDQDNFYYLEIISPQRADTGFHLKKLDNGASQTLESTAPADLALNTEYRLHVQYKAGANTFAVSLETLDDGIVVHKFEDVVDDTFRGGQVGVWANASFTGQFDNLTVLGEPSGAAERPSPSDGALIEETWVTLKWQPGNFAVSHDVYLGDNYDAVNEGAEETFVGNQTTTMFVVGFPGFPVPDGLIPGATYYWRIDEVNEADPNSPWRGNVWSFSIPPKTAYAPDPVDGAGHVDPNAILTWTGGYGAKLHTVYIGDNYDEVDNATGGMPLGSPSYDPGTLEREKVLYWRVDEFDGFETHKGDIWSFTTPGAVGNPQPANGAADVQMIETLSWTAADNATSHELYFGTDADAVKNATTASPEYAGPKTLGAESYDPGGLDWDSSYAWRVDEVYPTGTVKGITWTFTTADFILVDDFESYDDIDPAPGEPGINRIFDKWIDGFGTLTNGALIGNDLPPYAETTIVHGGAQSMIYRYDNTGKTSEATLTLVYPRDWTEQGVTKLSLWNRGASANAPDRIYVALNGTAVVYHDDPAATQSTGWKEWVVDLAAFGIDLTNVNSITIGVGTKNAPAPTGGTGTLYFDDIRLYRP